MSLQGRQRGRELEMCSLHVLLACTHAYSASLLCSSVIDRCGWGSSRLSCAWRWNNPSSSVSLFLICLSCSESPQLWRPSCPLCMRVIAYKIVLSPKCYRLDFFFVVQQMTLKVSKQLCWYYWKVNAESDSHPGCLSNNFMRSNE